MARGKRARVTESDDLAQVEAAEAKRARLGASEQQQPRQQEVPEPVNAPDRREVMADVARRRAAHFANYAADDDEEALGALKDKAARTLGPWSSARQLVEARSAAVAARQEKILDASRVSPDKAAISWKPTRDIKLGTRRTCRVRPLYEMCADVLTEYVEDIETLEGLPDSIKVKLAAVVCQQRKMSAEIVHLFTEGSPAEVIITNCSAIEPDHMATLLRDVATPRLERLELTFCGRGLTEAAAKAFAAAGPLDRLQVLALRGAYRLTDAALCSILASMPNLQVLRLPQNSLLSGSSIKQLPSLVPLLREIDLTECRGVSLAALQAALTGALPALETVTLAGIPEVSNALLAEVALGVPLKHLSVGRCALVGDEGLRGLAAACPQLQSLRAEKCTKITDDGVVALAEGCKELQSLSLEGCTKVSDEAVAAVALHGNLHYLSVHGIPSIGMSTMKALATATRERLEELDISWCRQVPLEAVGVLADTCEHLKKVHVWGCSQISELFLHGHSNDSLQILGGKLDTSQLTEAKIALTVG